MMAADTEYAKKQLESTALCDLFPDFVSALREALNLELEPLSESKLTHTAVPTDQHKVFKVKQKALPSPLRMQIAYRWLCSFNMVERLKTRCAASASCRFLADWLSPGKRKGFDEHGGLDWCDGNETYQAIAQGKLDESPARDTRGVDDSEYLREWFEQSKRRSPK